MSDLVGTQNCCFYSCECTYLSTQTSNEIEEAIFHAGYVVVESSNESIMSTFADVCSLISVFDVR